MTNYTEHAQNCVGQCSWRGNNSNEVKTIQRLENLERIGTAKIFCKNLLWDALHK